MVQIAVIHGIDKGRTWDLTTGLFTLGRDSTNFIHLQDQEVSRKHLEIVVDSQGLCRIRDLDSVNGTYLNTQKCKESRLLHADKIQVGQTILQILGQEAKEEGTRRVRLTDEFQYPIESAIIKSASADLGAKLLAKPLGSGISAVDEQLNNLRMIYEVSNAVSRILDQQPLLDKLLELIFQTLSADHGTILLFEESSGELVPQATRNRRASSEEKVISRSILNLVLSTNQGVLLNNVREDSRFNREASIAKYHFEEVLCVPMQGRYGRVGVLFLSTVNPSSDSEKKRPLFREDHLQLAVAIAHQAAIAIEETRFRQALMQAEHLAAIGQTIAGLSHHIKNIMQGIVFGSDMVRMGIRTTDMEILRKGWTLVEKNQTKIHDLVMDMLNFSKEREPNLEPVQPKSIIEEVVELLRGRLNQCEIDFQVQYLTEITTIQADPEGLHRALMNLIGNAIDALLERDLPRKMQIQAQEDRANRLLKIRVIDNGLGIPEEIRSSIFKPFISSKGSRGTGLGLPVSKKILQEHGGDLTFTTEMGQGTTFEMVLPYPAFDPSQTESLPSL